MKNTNLIKGFQNPFKLQKQECLRIEGAESGEFLGDGKFFVREGVSKEVVQGLFLLKNLIQSDSVLFCVGSLSHTFHS